MMNSLVVITLLISLYHQLIGANFNLLDVSIDATYDIFFHNVSYGLNHHIDPAQCFQTNKQSPKTKLTFTPNRLNQKESITSGEAQRLKLAVVLAVGGHSDSHYNYGPFGSINGLLSVWDSWVDNFFSQTTNTTSLVLLFDERDFRRQNVTKTKDEYLESILEKNLGAKPVFCARLRHKKFFGNSSSLHNHNLVDFKVRGNHGNHHSNSHRQSCGNDLPLDQGYKVYSITPKDDPSIRPLIIFASLYDFPLAEWVKKEEEETLFKEWKPFRLNRRYPTNYGYVKMTNWYSYYMLTLSLLDFFDYGGKIDNDVSFVAPFPETNLPLKLARSNSYVLNTQNGWYHDDPRICQGVALCLQTFMKEEAKLCSTRNHPVEFIPGGFSDQTFWENNYNTTFRSHFLIFWLGLYTAPETVRLAKYWNYFHPRGMWDFRWGDQQWWPRPVAMFGDGKLNQEIIHYDEINTDNEKYLVHKLWPRWATIPKVDYFHYNGTTKESRQAKYEAAAKQFK